MDFSLMKESQSLGASSSPNSRNVVAAFSSRASLAHATRKYRCSQIPKAPHAAAAAAPINFVT
jgi:hypothetical protein